MNIQQQKSGNTMNRNVILRLSRYKNAVYRLKRLGFVKVFSDNIADAAGETSSRVRKDFSLFGISGSKKGGYTVDELIAQLNEVLGKNGSHTVVVVGAGKIGRALIDYTGLDKGGIKIAAGFDIDPDKHTTDSRVPIYPLGDLPEFAVKHSVRIGIIAVPDIAAQQALDMMVSSGIEGILNFAPVRLHCPEHVVITNVNIEIELENLIYFVNAQKKGIF
jgi:redox-sensing transcriptional repressor